MCMRGVSWKRGGMKKRGDEALHNPELGGLMDLPLGSSMEERREGMGFSAILGFVA